MTKRKCDRCGTNIPCGEEFYIKVSFTNRYRLCPTCEVDWDKYLWKLSEQFVEAGVFINKQEAENETN